MKKLLVVIVFLLPTTAFADTIYTKNGEIYTGMIISYENDICVVQVGVGAVRRIQTTDIVNLITDNDYEMHLSDGRILAGQFIEIDDKFYVQQKDNSNIDSPIEQIVKMKVMLSTPEKEEFGEEDDETAPLNFLSGSTVLLNSGNIELDVELMHKQNTISTALMQAGYWERSTYSARQLELGITTRMGLWQGSEAALRVPFTYGKVKDVSTNAYVRGEEKYQMGDISLNLQQLILEEGLNVPAISFSLGVTAPSGKKEYRRHEDSWLNVLDGGNGNWNVNVGLSFVRTSDPAVIFGGIGYIYYFERSISGYDVQLGDGIYEYLGLGFAMNEKLSVGFRVSHTYYDDMKADGTTVEGSATEPLALAVSASYRAFNKYTITPELNYGLNDDAGTTSISIRVTRGF